MERNKKGQFVKGIIPWGKLNELEIGTIRINKFTGGKRRVIKVSKGRDHNYMKYSRWLMEQKLGRKLKSNECVHHINENKLDDRIENLKLMTNGKHISLHRKGKIPIAGIKAAAETNKRRRRKWQPEIKKLYKQGLSLRKITIRLNLSRSTITRTIKEMGYKVEISRCYHQERNKWKPKILELRKKGLSYPKIAKLVPFSRITIGKIIRGAKKC